MQLWPVLWCPELWVQERSDDIGFLVDFGSGSNWLSFFISQVSYVYGFFSDLCNSNHRWCSYHSDSKSLWLIKHVISYSCQPLIFILYFTMLNKTVIVRTLSCNRDNFSLATIWWVMQRELWYTVCLSCFCTLCFWFKMFMYGRNLYVKQFYLT